MRLGFHWGEGVFVLIALSLPTSSSFSRLSQRHPLTHEAIAMPRYSRFGFLGQRNSFDGPLTPPRVASVSTLHRRRRGVEDVLSPAPPAWEGPVRVLQSVSRGWVDARAVVQDMLLTLWAANGGGNGSGVDSGGDGWELVAVVHLATDTMLGRLDVGGRAQIKISNKDPIVGRQRRRGNDGSGFSMLCR